MHQNYTIAKTIYLWNLNYSYISLNHTMPYSPNIPAVNNRYAAAYADPKGEGDARPAALDIIDDEGLVGKLSDKVALVTGGTSGIGFEIVRALAKTGMTVFYTTRDVAKGQIVKQQLLGEDPNYNLEVVQIELGSLKSVKKAAENFLSRAHRLDVLMLNAGQSHVIFTMVYHHQVRCGAHSSPFDTMTDKPSVQASGQFLEPSRTMVSSRSSPSTTSLTSIFSIW